jgi:hypothetical protein
LDSSRPSLISQAWNQWLLQAQQKINVINETLATLSSGSVTPGGALGVSSGGTGATTASVAFGNLSPLTTRGDMLIYNGGNIRLPINTDGFVLQIVAGIPTWVNPSAGSSPLTTKGDLYGYSTAPARIPVGLDTYVLTADSTNTLGVSWKPAGTPTLPVTTKGDILGYSTFPARIPVGTDGQALLADSTQPLGVKWGSAGSSSPLTTKGDLYGFSTVNARIPVGTDGQVLTGDSSSPTGISWKPVNDIYTVPPFSDVVSLLHFSGTVGSSTFTDQVTGVTWVAGAGASISNTETFINTTSGYFNGTTSAYINTTSANTNFGSSNFTIEFSVYLPSGGPATGSLLRINTNTTTGYGGLLLNVASNGNILIYASSNGSSWNLMSSGNGGTVSVGAYTQYLLERYGNTLLIYVNGFFTNQLTLSGALYYAAGSTTIWGGIASSTSALMYLNECRMTSGLTLVKSYNPLTVEFPNS